MQQKAHIIFVYVCPSVCSHVSPTGRIFMKFDTGKFYETCQKNLNIVEFWYLALYMKTKVRFIVIGDKNSSEAIRL